MAAAATGCSASTTKSVAEGVDATSPPLTFSDAGKHPHDASDANVVAAVDAGVDAGPTGPSCSSPDASSSQACGTLSFATSSVASRPRNHHVTLTAPVAGGGTMLYALGGANARAPISFVDRVPLAADGSLGTWVTDQALPFAAGGLVAELVSGVIVEAGGVLLSGSYTDTAFASVLNADGSLGAWQNAPAMNEPRMHAGSIARGNTMWVLGGFNNDTVYSDIISATVSSTGTVSAWQPAGTLPETLSHFTVSLVDDDIYLTGGLDASALNDPPDLSTTWHGKLQADGTLGAWVAGPTLPVAEATHGAFVYGGYLHICGGINNVPAEDDRCWRAPIQADRSLGTFEEIASLPLARGHVHQLPLVGNVVYSVGGAIDFNLDSTTDIFLGTFDTSGGGMGKKVAPRAVRPATPGPVPTHGAKCHLTGC